VALVDVVVADVPLVLVEPVALAAPPWPLPPVLEVSPTSNDCATQPPIAIAIVTGASGRASGEAKR